jgi:hypothetical protein
MRSPENAGQPCFILMAAVLLGSAANDVPRLQVTKCAECVGESSGSRKTGPLLACPAKGLRLRERTGCDDQIHLPQLAKLNFAPQSIRGEARGEFSQSSRANVSSKSLNKAASRLRCCPESSLPRRGARRVGPLDVDRPTDCPFRQA